MFHVWRSWLKRHWKGIQQQRSGRSKPRFRPQLEVLEDRRLLATLTVNNVADTANPNDNFLTLREAIQVVNGKVNINQLSAAAQNQINTKANPLGTNDIIQFNIGAGTQTISVKGSALDTITKPVIIDGTAPAANPDQVIVLDGTSFQNAKMKGVNGLTINAVGVEVKELTIQNFTGYGIEIDAPKAAKNGVTNNKVDGDTITGNSYSGLWIHGASYNTIGTVDGQQKVHGNDISSNKSGGVRVTGTNDDHNVFQGNTIISNTNQGIYLDINANATTIGSLNPGNVEGLGNLIAGNTGDGISMQSTRNQVGGNDIGIQSSNGFPAGLVSGNEGNGISIYGNDNFIGSKNKGSGNIMVTVQNAVRLSRNFFRAFNFWRSWKGDGPLP